MTDVPPPATEQQPEYDISAFETDPRAYFDRQSGTWRMEDDNGDELEYDPAKGKWVPVVRIPSCCASSHRVGGRRTTVSCPGRRGARQEPASCIFG